MSWNNNDGPWGSPDKNTSGNPWTKKPGPSGTPPRPPGGSPPPFDFDKVFRDFWRLIQSFLGHYNSPSHMAVIIVALVIIAWLLSGIYQVGTNQSGVVMRFGAFNRIETAGLHYHSPYPIEDVLLPNVTSQNKIEIGFRSGDTATPMPAESMMLTQDENIIDVEFTVFWHVNDIEKFLFTIRDPELTIKMAAESAMREVIGQNKLQFELTDGRSQIADATLDRLQKLMDTYQAGVTVTQINLQTVAVPDEVKAAFQDVVNARLDQERFRNEAETHANEVIPKAKGDDARYTQQALAYRDQKIAIAQGDAARFKEVLAAYDASKEVTAKRLYLETMEAVLSGAHKIILDKSGSGTVPYLGLQDLLRSKTSAAPEGDAR